MPPKKGALGSALFSDVESLEEKEEVTKADAKKEEAREIKEISEVVSEQPVEKLPQQEGNKWGKRGKSDYSQICGQIPKQLHLQFKSKVALTGKDMAIVLEELIENYVKP